MSAFLNYNLHRDKIVVIYHKENRENHQIIKSAENELKIVHAKAIYTLLLKRPYSFIARI